LTENCKLGRPPKRHDMVRQWSKDEGDVKKDEETVNRATVKGSITPQPGIQKEEERNAVFGKKKGESEKKRGTDVARHECRKGATRR